MVRTPHDYGKAPDENPWYSQVYSYYAKTLAQQNKNKKAVPNDTFPWASHGDEL